MFIPDKFQIDAINDVKKGSNVLVVAHTGTHTHTRKHTDTQTHRHTDTHSHSHTDRDKQTQTDRKSTRLNSSHP